MLMDVEGEMDRDLADIIAAASMINLHLLIGMLTSNLH